ncbi:MAG: hypothetical protein QM601_02535 [Pseudoxanthomonas sp.]
MIEPASRRLPIGLLLALAAPAAAQQAPTPTEPAPAADVATLDTVEALPPEDHVETLDLDRFKNPIQVPPNTFDKRWSPPPSPKEISENGGYLVYGMDKLVGAAKKGLQRLPGVRGQTHPASARPPPLSAEQMDRAAALCQDPACGSAGP